MSRNNNSLLIFIWVLFLSFSAFASLESGNKYFLEKKYEEASKEYQNHLQSDPSDASAWVNLALSEYHRGNSLYAVAYFRKALGIHPSNAEAKAGLKFVQNQMRTPQVPQNLSLLETLNKGFLDGLPLEALFLVSLLLFATGGFLLIRYLGQRKLALEKESMAPPSPVICMLFLVFFVIFSSLFALKIWDAQFERGSIVVDKTSLQTAPGEDQVAIMDLQGGYEIKVLQTQGDWLQVSYPGTPRGWIKKSDVMMTH